MVDGVNLNSSLVALLNSYNRSQEQLSRLQMAASTGQDINTASDNPLFYMQAQTLRAKAGAYTAVITKIAQEKSEIDKLQGTLATINDTATKLQNVITGISTTPSKVEEGTAASQITNYLKTIQNLIDGSVDASGFGLAHGQMVVDVAPNVSLNAATSQNDSPFQTLTLTSPYLSIFGPYGILTQTSSDLPEPQYDHGYISLQNGTTYGVADLSTATNRANLLASVSNWISTSLVGAAGRVGAFADSLDAELTAMRTNQTCLNAEADALTKTDLTADAAKSTALQAQQQLITNLLSAADHQTNAVISLFL